MKFWYVLSAENVWVEMVLLLLWPYCDGSQCHCHQSDVHSTRLTIFGPATEPINFHRLLAATSVETSSSKTFYSPIHMHLYRHRVILVVSILRLRNRWLIWWPGGSGGFVHILCNSLSERPIPLSCESAGVTLAESDETDDFLTGLRFVWVDSFDLVTEHSDNTLSSLSESFGLLALSSSSVSALSQERSTDRPLPNDLRSLSTSRIWNLFKLPWLPDDGFGGEQLSLVRVGVVNEVCDVRDDVRENAFALELLRFMKFRWLSNVLGDVEKLGHSDRVSLTLRERHAFELFEHSDTFRVRPAL